MLLRKFLRNVLSQSKSGSEMPGVSVSISFQKLWDSEQAC